VTVFVNKKRVASVLLALTFMAGSAWADDFSIAGRELSIKVPGTYCALDRDDPVEKEMFEVMEQVQDGLNRVLLVFYDCAELRAMHRGEHSSFGRYGQVLTPIREQAYPGISRDAFFAELRKVFDRAFAIGAERGRANVAKSIPDMQIGEARSLGILGTDPRALYAGMLEKVTFDGEVATVAAVVSVTLLKDVPISVNLYRSYEDEASFDVLLEEQRSYMERLMRLNEQLEGSTAPRSDPSGIDG
jgi:hypothetical protein